MHVLRRPLLSASLPPFPLCPQGERIRHQQAALQEAMARLGQQEALLAGTSRQMASTLKALQDAREEQKWQLPHGGFPHARVPRHDGAGGNHGMQQPGAQQPVRRRGRTLLGSFSSSSSQAHQRPYPSLYVVTSHVADADFPRFYKSGNAFVLPSRGEGWGRPHVEVSALVSDISTHHAHACRGHPRGDTPWGHPRAWLLPYALFG